MITNIPYMQSSEIPVTLIQENKKNLVQEDNVEFNQLVHDLKSPVNSLKGIVELANSQIQDQQAREFFYMINLCVDKLEEKIVDTLSMFQSQPQLTEINFPQLIEEIRISLGHIKGFDDVEFKVDIQNNTPFFSAKPILESILQNLIENAIKYRCRERDVCQILVAISDNDNGVQIRIEDNGIGIDKESLPRIFDANVKAMMAGENSHGLGLYIVKKAVEKIHGTIEVKSTLDQGTCFTLDLPNGGDASKYLGNKN